MNRLIIGMNLVFSLGFSAALAWVICWAFGYEFLWKYAFGLWAIIVVLKISFGGKNVQ